MTDTYVWQVVAVIALVTALLRFLPFFIFGGNKTPPRIIEKLGNVLPPAVMGMLVVYCLKDIRVTEPSSVLPAVLACAVVGVLYVWKRNTLLSIVSGTLCYMLLVQFLF